MINEELMFLIFNRCQKWIEQCRLYISNCIPEICNKLYRLCSDHFDSSQYNGNNLKFDAVPTIFNKSSHQQPDKLTVADIPHSDVTSPIQTYVSEFSSTDADNRIGLPLLYSTPRLESIGSGDCSISSNSSSIASTQTAMFINAYSKESKIAKRVNPL